MNKPSKGFTATAVWDDDLKVITAYFNELPGLIVQGSSMNDVDQKLKSLLASFRKRLEKMGNDIEIIEHA